MRRRPKYQELKAAGVLDQNPIALAAKGINPFPPDGFATDPKTKSRCNKCGKDFPKGIYMHSKTCLGSLEQIPDWKMRQQIEAVRGAMVEPEREKIARALQSGWSKKVYRNKHWRERQALLLAQIEGTKEGDACQPTA